MGAQPADELHTVKALTRMDKGWRYHANAIQITRRSKNDCAQSKVVHASV